MGSLPKTKSKAGGDFVRRVSIKGQVTLPLEVRRFLGIRPKDRVTFTVEAGEVKVKLIQSPLLESFQAIPALKSPLSVREMKRIAGEEQAGLAAREGS